MFDWTDEQKAIVAHELKPNEATLVQGYAGCSKTTTLFEMCKSRWNVRILYVAFNRSLMEATRSKFRDYPHVRVETFHSYALRELQTACPETDFEVLETITVYEVMEALRTEDYEHAAAGLRVLERFYASTDSDLDDVKHASHLGRGLSPVLATRIARAVWTRTLQGSFPYSHDAYLKRFALMRPHVPYDVILVDEAQDITPLQMELVRTQTHAAHVFVGDEHQTLYGFRFVCNPFAEIPASGCPYRSFTLSKSFRFGKDVSGLSSQFLTWFKCDAGLRIESHETQGCTDVYHPPERDEDVPKGAVYLYRSNRELVRGLFAMSEYDHVRTVAVLGNSFVPTDELRALDELDAFSRGEKTHEVRPGLRRCRTLDELASFYASVRDFKAKARIDLYREFGGETLRCTWERVQDKYVETPDEADRIVGTVHQAKGLEFDVVRLGPNFPSLQRLSQVSPSRKASTNEVLNIVYVAMTRAKTRLYLNDDLSAFVRQMDTQSDTHKLADLWNRHERLP